MFRTLSTIGTLLVGIGIGSLFSDVLFVREVQLQERHLNEGTAAETWDRRFRRNAPAFDSLRAAHATQCRTVLLPEPTDFVWVHEAFVADNGTIAYFVGQTGRKCWRDKNQWPWSKAKASQSRFFGKRFVAELNDVVPSELARHLPRSSMFSICRNLPHNSSQFDEQVVLIACPIPADLQDVLRLSPYVHLQAWLHFVGDEAPRGEAVLPASFLDQSGAPWATLKRGPFQLCQMTTDVHFGAVPGSKVAKLIEASHVPLSLSRRVKIGACAHIAPVTDYRLVEWVEFHLLMGIEHFWFFDNSQKPSQSTAKILLPYVLAGQATLIHWPFPIQDGCDQSQAGAQFSVGNVCLRRYAQDADWLAFFDVDEFLLPLRRNSTLTTLVDRFSRPDWQTVRSDESSFLCSRSRLGRVGCDTAERGVSAISLSQYIFAPCANPALGQALDPALSFLHLANDSCAEEPMTIQSADRAPKSLYRSYRSFSVWVHYLDVMLAGTVVVILDWRHDALLVHCRRGRIGASMDDDTRVVNARVAAILPELARNVVRFEMTHNISILAMRQREDELAAEQLKLFGPNRAYLVSYEADEKKTITKNSTTKV